MARVIYCSATGVPEPRNMAFMNRLGLWGTGTPFEGFNAYLKFLDNIGNGGAEMYAIYLKKQGQMLSRTLSYAGADFQLIDGVMDEEVRIAYEKGTKMFDRMLGFLETDRIPALQEADDARKQRARIQGELPHNELLDDILVDSDSDYEDEIEEERLKRRKLRAKTAKSTKTLFFGSHLRFFQALCVCAKVPKAIEVAKEAIQDGHSVVLGLQATGEARTKDAVDGIEKNEEVRWSEGGGGGEQRGDERSEAQRDVGCNPVTSVSAPLIVMLSFRSAHTNRPLLVASLTTDWGDRDRRLCQRPQGDPAPHPLLPLPFAS